MPGRHALDKEKLRAFLRALACLDEGPQDEDSLFSSGIIDSLSLIELVQFIEAEAGFKVSAMELTLDRWDCISRIMAYSEEKAAR